jgi:hypothetical protein
MLWFVINHDCGKEAPPTLSFSTGQRASGSREGRYCCS